MRKERIIEILAAIQKVMMESDCGLGLGWQEAMFNVGYYSITGLKNAQMLLFQRVNGKYCSV